MIVSQQTYNDKEFIFIYRNVELFLDARGESGYKNKMNSDFAGEILTDRNDHVKVTKDRSGHLRDPSVMTMKKFIKFAQISYEEWN